MDDFITCKYCQECLIISYSNVGKLVDKYINNYNKKIKKGFDTNFEIEVLKMMVKLCPNIESYIQFNNHEIYLMLGPYYFSNITRDASYFLRKSYLHDRKDTYDSNLISCDYCGKEACNYHLRYGGFEYNICDCDNNMIICGWCQEKINEEYKNKCIHCFKKSWNKRNSIKLDKLSSLEIYTNKEKEEI